MASQRMPPTADTDIATEARSALRKLAHARQAISEIAAKLSAYDNEPAAIATDLGVADGETARGLFTKAARELEGTFMETVAQDAKGNACLLADRMA